MKKLRLPIILAFIFVLINESQAMNEKNYLEDEKFKIVFVSSSWSLKSDWLDEIKNKWGATGVSLFIPWIQNEPVEGKFDFRRLDSNLSLIKNQGLDINIRIPMGFEYPEWITKNADNKFSKNDYQLNKQGEIFKTDYVPTGVLNFASETSKNCMLNYLTAIVKHFNELRESGYDIKEIVPSVDPDAEFEYTSGFMLGYSSFEKNLFRNYLTRKYNNDVNLLNFKWKASFKNFEEIDPAIYNWEKASLQNYNISAGRYDWMKFRTASLKSFIDECAQVIHSYNFKMGLQLGSICDEYIEYRGWYDPTSLLENVDAVRVADIAEYRPNFNFSADYLRTLCNYWSERKNKKISFSSESNWAGYPKPHGYSPERLCSDWDSQLKSYYEKGSDAHYVMGWYLDWNTLNKIKAFGEGEYKNWRTTLNEFSNKNRIKVKYDKAVYLSSDYAFYFGNIHTDTTIDKNYYLKFKLYNSIVPRFQYKENERNYDNHSDILTNYILENSPEVLNNYSTFSFTLSSEVIPNTAYANLIAANYTAKFMNGTEWSSSSGSTQTVVNPGKYNEYKNTRNNKILINKMFK
ncbi:MAG: beta-galactosidase [Bacteroidetes bacterium]|nr:beta-galactosidase [Bacteroidota bacterium]